MSVRTNCTNCGKNIIVNYREYKDAKWFEGNCSSCDTRFMFKDYLFDYVQPDSEFFEPIYRYNPQDIEKKKKIEKEYAEEQRKVDLERKYFYKYINKTGGISSITNASEYKKIKQVVLD